MEYPFVYQARYGVPTWFVNVALNKNIVTINIIRRYRLPYIYISNITEKQLSR